MQSRDGDQIRVIVLEQGEDLSTTIRRLSKGWTLRFTLGASVLGQHVEITTSYPDQPQPLKWVRESDTANDDMSLYAQLKCTIAGSYSYTFHVKNESDVVGKGYFLVDPDLRVRGERVPLECIQCITHIAKQLGPLSQWPGRLQVAREAGYNMLHLTPVQALGVSNSSYCIADHLQLNPAFAANSHGDLKDIAKLVSQWENEWAMLTIQDVVWNHAAKNSPWLLEHPECAYNCVNSPHLRPAYVLDRVYHHFSREIAQGKWSERGLPAEITEHAHLQALREILVSDVLPRVRLAEFFQLPIDELVDEFARLANNGVTQPNIDEFLDITRDEQFRRFGNRVDMQRALAIFNRYRSVFDESGLHSREM